MMISYIKSRIIWIAALLIVTVLIGGAFGYYHSKQTGEEGGQTSTARGIIDIEVLTENPVAKDRVEIQVLILDPDTNNLVPHIDYVIKIMKDGSEIFRKSFHDHEGDLKLIFIYREGDVKVSGSAGAGGIYTIEGPIFGSAGSYTIKASVVGIEFNPIDPFSNEKTISIGEEVAQKTQTETEGMEGTSTQTETVGQETTEEMTQTEEGTPNMEGGGETVREKGETSETVESGVPSILYWVIAILLIAVAIGAYMRYR